MNKKKLLCVIPDLDAPFIINLRQPLQLLKNRGALSYTAIKEKDATIHDVLGHDAVLFFRSSSPNLLKLLYFAKLSGKPVIFAVDDNFFELANSEMGAMDPVRLGAHERFIRKADMVMVYSNPMLERAGRLNKNAVKIIPGVDFSVLEGLERQANCGKTRIVYATWRNKRDILSDLFIPAIKRLLQEYSGQVEMHFWGFVPEELKGTPGVNHMPRTDYETYLRLLYSGAFDIGLAPLKDDEFHRSKTNTKFRDYGACGIAGVYSNVDVYSDCVRDRETGLLVVNTYEGWYGGIKKLIENPGLRASIKDKAFKYVREHYDTGRVAADLDEIIDNALMLKRPAVLSRPPRCRLSSLFDIKTPRILYVSSEYKADNIAKIQGLYGYHIHILNNKLFGSRRALRFHDIIIFGTVGDRLRKKLTEKARFLNKKIIMSRGAPVDGMINLVEEMFFEEILVNDPKPYSFSFRMMCRKLKPYRSAISFYLFKKTGLKNIEKIFRESIMKPVKNYARRVFQG
jgi:glycosyltransferase involved in cell wall biosynthesis